MFPIICSSTAKKKRTIPTPHCRKYHRKLDLPFGKVGYLKKKETKVQEGLLSVVRMKGAECAVSNIWILVDANAVGRVVTLSCVHSHLLGSI